MESIVTAIVGVICIVIGVCNRKGNISMIHSYHIDKISEEDKIPFGRLMGIGMIIVGVTLIVFGGMSFLATALHDDVYVKIGYIIMSVGLAVGLGISLFSIKKYNKTIF